MDDSVRKSWQIQPDRVLLKNPQWEDGLEKLKVEIEERFGDDLADVISQLGPEDESFALLLSHEYTEKSMRDLGTRGLKGVDRVRVGALEEANALGSPILNSISTWFD
ncbi:unnamed protein product [Phytophthora lilii]|uniref:Unnamed protein product n=1 Tax=Phytophthora lilii TaxID=2077276 RepID=A0A9W7D8I6_9STRA|nr:unnamed protein product [Phytophthora lilii]